MTLCKHGTEKDTCLDCYTSTICPHNKKIIQCVECRGNLDCRHYANTTRKDCNLCKPILCEVCNLVYAMSHSHCVSRRHQKNLTCQPKPKPPPIVMRQCFCGRKFNILKNHFGTAYHQSYSKLLYTNLYLSV